jgi:hypothetical protein
MLTHQRLQAQGACGVNSLEPPSPLAASELPEGPEQERDTFGERLHLDAMPSWRGAAPTEAFSFPSLGWVALSPRSPTQRTRRLAHIF